MKPMKTLACISMLAALAACGPSDGYYDSLGNYHYGSRYNNASDSTVQPGFSGSTYYGNNYYTDESARRGDSKRVIDYDRARDADRLPYRRAGYYDYRGRYVPASRDVIYVDREYWPSRGMCRVWYDDRDYADQPVADSCTTVYHHVPQGAYVIYGG